MLDSLYCDDSSPCGLSSAAEFVNSAGSPYSASLGCSKTDCYII